VANKEKERFEIGKRRDEILMVTMIVAYVLYEAACRLQYHDGVAGFALFTLPTFLLTCLGYRKIKWAYYFFAAVLCVVGLLGVYAGVLVLAGYLMNGMPYDRDFRLLLLTPLALLHGVSIYVLETGPVRAYLEATAEQRRKQNKENKKNRRR